MRKLLFALLTIAACLLADVAARGQQLRAPQRVQAGAGATLETSGSGDATLFLVGPASASKRPVRLGEKIKLGPEEVRAAGRYTAILRSGSDSQTAVFYVEPAPPANVSFIARPSRVPAARPKVVSGVAFVFDDYKNLVLQPSSVTFE